MKIWLIDLNSYKIQEGEIPEREFNRKKELRKDDLYALYGYRDSTIYFQLTEESAKNSLRKYIQTAIELKQKEIATLQNHLHALN